MLNDNLVIFLFILSLNLIVLGLSCTESPGGRSYPYLDPTLPDPLIMENGAKVNTPAQWENTRRQEILDIFNSQIYGKIPEKSSEIYFLIESTENNVLGGLADRFEITLFVFAASTPLIQKISSVSEVTAIGTDYLDIHILMYLPNGRTNPVPAFVGLNFFGNQAVNSDPGITITDKWVHNNDEFHIYGNTGTEESRGARAEYWQAEYLMEQGYALVTAYYGDIDPDYDDGFQNGVHPLFYDTSQTEPREDEWGAISAWAWGLMRIMDYLMVDINIDSNRVAVMGHSRLGKTALWVGALDQRFPVVISNNSGCMGAAISRRKIGETVALINSTFPHWFCDQFKQYNNNEENLPIDQHMLIALIAPRPVYVASAVEDLWSDPEGEFIAALNANPVYHLLGTNGLPTTSMPEIEQPVHGTIGYHIRNGGHKVTLYDWQNYVAFANKHFSTP